MILAGEYPEAEVTGSALTPGKNTDDPVIEIYFLADGMDGIAWLYTTESAWPYTEKKLKACGFDPAEHDHDLSPLNLDGDENPIRGNRVRILVEDQEYKGKVRPKITQIGEGTFSERMEPQQAKTFTASLRQRLKAGQGIQTSKPKAAAKPPTRPAARKQAEDDVPF